MAGSIGGAIGMFGGAVGDLFTAQADRAIAKGDWDAAQQYNYAGTIAEANKQLTELSTQIQETQLQRKIDKTIGAEQSAVGGANLGPGGTAGDLLRESMQQGSLAKQLVSTQGAINENAFESQAAAYRAMRASSQAASNAADKAAQGAEIGAAFKFGSGIMGLFGI